MVDQRFNLKRARTAHFSRFSDEQSRRNDINSSFEIALQQKPGDAQVLLALGVLQFIQRDYIKAANFFEMAIKEDPENHSLWNKYGAALA